MPIDMNSFWSDWGVDCGNQSSNNWYNTFNGLKMSDGYVCGNFKDFLNWNNLSWGTFDSRYTFFKNFNNIDPLIIDEKTFYENTSDPGIYDFKTFYEIAPSYYQQCLT